MCKSNLGFCLGFFFLFGFVFPPACRGSRRSRELGDPHNQAGKSPLRRSLHATGWNWYRESFVACKQCQFAWNGVLLVSFFGLHGIRHLTRDTSGPAPTSYSLTHSGLFGESLVNPPALPEKPPRTPSSAMSELGGAASPVSSEETPGQRIRGWQRLRPGSGSIPACCGSGGSCRAHGSLRAALNSVA